MSLKFHVFAEDKFLLTLVAGNRAIDNFQKKLEGNSIPHYGYRKGEVFPKHDGWYTMHSLSKIPDENVPPTIRMLHLLMNY